ncbi:MULTISPECIES: YbaK/prolyl-tRNA synthetase associated domain-containing protein [Pantoea]|jgi:Ala-tRNA(Pro) deacylase|uniref:YbaK/prolyl-tRNA synthetase associated domain-containing protein n=1 Tax=Pantoea TaxID=53335 RepID=UPI0008FCEE81|nr:MULTISPECIES: YbaK/prolyl-tRNA synthetase associated domain-containing protein [Pantoea]MCL9647646.1 YbaK/prolyl-tRNA synthetase associated domain-containing protein [Pantoea eucrina]MDJ0022466.1 YbaK/prolyl-tRNA synthetase associated domain-containing protein [Pantoea eucrina]OIX99033.1 hypothetical protein BFS13_11735 [Pantoea sp. Ae16]
MTTHEKLIALLDQHGAQYRLLEHAANGKCEAVAALRGTEVGQGAKALVCHVKGNGIKQYVLAVLPADRQADLSKVAAAVGGRRASLASPAEVDALTACVFGAIPPFSFHEDLRLVVDPLLFERYGEIAFNAGVLERSVVMNINDYQRLHNGNVMKIIL